MKVLAFLAGLLAAFPCLAGPALMFGLPYPSSGSQENAVNVNSSGQLTITTLSGEDTVNSVFKVEQQFSYSGDRTADGSAIKSSAGFVHTVVCQGTDAAATAGTIALLDSTAAGAGTKVWEWDVQAVALTTPSTVILDAVMGTGIFLDFTTTADVSCTVTYR